MDKKYNLKNPAVKRLMREAAELKDPTVQYYAQPLEDNLFEWHFTVRGPPDTEFSDGIYHGRITLPPEYPMKPPSIILLTPNGRFEVGKKICLSMSAHHPETWQPSWSLRTVLLALIGFMPTKGAGAIGSLDYTPEERKLLAAKSIDWKCGTCDFDHRTSLLDVDPECESKQMHEAKELAAQINFKGEGERSKSSEQSTVPSLDTTVPFEGNQQLGDPSATNLSQNISLDQGESYVKTHGDGGLQNSSADSTSSNVIRQRHTAPAVEEVYASNETSEIQQIQGSNRTQRSSAADFISLILLWIVAAVLVFLILRRLALDNNALSNSNN